MKNAAKSTATITGTINHTTTRRDFLRTSLNTLSILAVAGGTMGNTAHGDERVEEMIKLLTDINGLTRSNYPNTARPEVMQLVEEVAKRVDPILIGRNVVFGPNWLNYVGDRKMLTRQQFEQWRNRVDMVADAYTDFAGIKPYAGKVDKSFVDLGPKKIFNPNAVGTQITNTALVNVGCPNFMRSLREEIVGRGSPGRVVTHELAHIYADAYRWEVENESTAELLVSYALENIPNMRLGVPGMGAAYTPVSGRQLRQQKLNEAQKNFRAGTIKDFANHHTGGCAYDYYLFGLVDVVGWDVYKKAVHSYLTDGLRLRVNQLRGDARRPAARDFFNRLEYFSEKPGVLRSLPDKGQILDKFFGAHIENQFNINHKQDPSTRVTTNNNTTPRPTPRATPPTTQAPPQATSPPPQASPPPTPAQDAEPAINPRTGRPLPARWTNPNL